MVQLIPEATEAVTLIGLVHRCMPFHQRRIKTQTMTSLFPQRQTPSCKLFVDTTPNPVRANRSGFMMCRWVRKNKAHLEVPTVPRLPKLFVGSFSIIKQAAVEPTRRPVPRLLFTTYLKPLVLKQQVRQNYCQGSRFTTSHQLRDLQKNRSVQFQLRGNAPLEFLEITPTITFRWSAGATQAKLMNSKEFDFSE